MKLFWINLQIKFWNFIYFFKNSNSSLKEVNCKHEFKKSVNGFEDGYYSRRYVCSKCGYVKYDSRILKVIK